MVSAEILRRYPFFAGIDHERLAALARIGHDVRVEPGHWFFHENDDVDAFYLALEGAVAIIMEVPLRGGPGHKVAEQFMRDYETEEIVVSTVGSGDVFAWSGLIPPHAATAGAKAVTPCRVVAFPRAELADLIEADWSFGYSLVVKAAQVISQRLRDLRIESLAAYRED